MIKNSIIQKIKNIWKDEDSIFFVNEYKKISIKEILSKEKIISNRIKKGDIVALYGDFDPFTIKAFLHLIDLGAIILPITRDTKIYHKYYLKTCSVDYLIKNKKILKLNNTKRKNRLIKSLVKKKKPGLILFTSGTTSNPKAILHDFSNFLKRYETPRPALRTLSFLLFDHIGGINTFFHTIFNKGLIVSVKNRTIDNIINAINKHKVELLPSTPTFLRMLLLKKSIKKIMPKCLKIITYGTEMMDEHTLKNLNKYFPKISFRQTYGMSELGIMRVKSKSNKSLFMKVGGEGVKLKTKNNILYIKSKNRMLAYLNHPTPFDKDGWYNTRDVVEKKGDYIKIVGRSDNIINVSGIKFFASEIESRILKFPGVKFVNVYGKKNPITGQHVILKVDINNLIFNHKKFKNFIREKLPKYMVPSKIIFDKIKISPRLKKEIKED